MSAYIVSETDQRHAVTILFARMACRQADGPCSTCLAYCREYITPRAWPILKSAFQAGITAQSISAAFGNMLMLSAIAEPSACRDETDDAQTDLHLEP